MEENIFKRENSEIRVLSLFSGCGGMDFGIEKAGGKVVFANDSSADACQTLRKYFLATEVVQEILKRSVHFPTLMLSSADTLASHSLWLDVAIRRPTTV